MASDSGQWRIWDGMPGYGDVLYRRAIGEALEMESSKAAARQLEGILRENGSLLDVGAGSGNYLRSLRRQHGSTFAYTGVDATEYYINLAKKAFAGEPKATFEVMDIYNLTFPARSFDVVMCCNVLLHLPSVVVPIQQLWNATSEFLLIRALIGKSSFRIKQVREWDESSLHDKLPDNVDPLFDESGEPREFQFYNIYSESYVTWLCSSLPGVERFEIVPDTDFDPAALGKTQWPNEAKPGDVTETVGGQQHNVHILQPWAWLKVWREKA